MLITRIQALVRGWLDRRKYRIIAMTTQVQTRYFKKDEAMETLVRGEKYDDKGAITTAKYTYTTNAQYDGQWLGGLRHGKGVMQWPDGARYDGLWQYN